MVFYSTCKINLALSVIARRDDGYSDIETVMYPIGGSLCDIVEMIPSVDGFCFSASGIEVDCDEQKNLCVLAFRLMQQKFDLPDVQLHLHKRIPFGAGLGAGSANAVSVIKLCNRLFALGLSSERMEELAARLGSDTAFFVNNQPAVARGRGEKLTPIDIDLRGYYVMLVKPSVGVSTAEAYSLVTPAVPDILPSQGVKYPIEEWYRVLRNDFQEAIYERLPVLSIIEGELYRGGAVFAAMSGSGSTVFGIFRDKPSLRFPHFTYVTQL